MKRFHVHVSVDDLEANIKFYSTVFESHPQWSSLTMQNGCWTTRGSFSRFQNGD